MSRDACFILLCTIALLTADTAVAENSRRAWDASISARILNVRAGPGRGYPIVSILRRGEKVRAFGEEGRWLHIREFSDDGATGWVHRSFVRLPKDFMAPAFSDAENAFLDSVSERGDLSELSIEADDRISIILKAGIAADRAGSIARELACAWRDLLNPKRVVTATVWPPDGLGDGWLKQESCP